MNDVGAAKKFKATHFDYVTFSGTFSRRHESALIAHSNLLCLDFDDIPRPNELRDTLLKDELLETQLAFVSPSGNGLKWVVEIDTEQYDHLTYFKGVANFIKKTYGLRVDQSGKDVCRACFIPYDPNAFIHPKHLRHATKTTF
jgi:hypothetical protein